MTLKEDKIQKNSIYFEYNSYYYILNLNYSDFNWFTEEFHQFMTVNEDEIQKSSI